MNGVGNGAGWLLAVALVIALISACSDESNQSSSVPLEQSNKIPEVIPKDFSPILDVTGSPLRLVSGPTPESPSSVTAMQVIAGDEYWSGMATIEVSGKHPITIEEASVVTSSGVKGVGVFIGRRNIDGLPGVTTHGPPGYDLPQFAGKRLPRAVGLVLQPRGPEMVVYAVAFLDKNTALGSIYGASLTIRDGDHLSEVMVLSPTILCAAKMTGTSEAQRCERYMTKVVNDVVEISN